MIHISGFEEFIGEQAPASAMARADYAATGDVAVVLGRGSAAGLAMHTGTVSRTMPWSTSTFSVGFAHQFTARGSVAWLDIGSKRVVLWMNPDTGMPMLNQSAGGALPTTNRWYYFEMEVDRNGMVKLRINNRDDSSINIGALADQAVTLTLGYLDPAAYRPGVDPVPSDAGTKTYDDLYMRDTAHLGPIAVTTRFPGADQHVEWFKSDDKSTHAQILAAHPPKPLDSYVASAQIGTEDRFTSAQPLINGNAIVATGVVVLARKSPAFDAKLGVFIGGPAAGREAKRVVDTDWKTQYVFFDQDGSDTPAKIASSEFGINVSAP